MIFKAKYEQKTFIFKRPGGTSRGILTEKKSWFITLWNEDNPFIKGFGECSVIPGLSPDYLNDKQYELKIEDVVKKINYFIENLHELKSFPSILFGLEIALLDLKNGGDKIFFNTNFTKGNQGIPINGLIWMGDEKFMQEQVEQKLTEGYSCIKMKIGAIDFEKEVKILESIRGRFSPEQITLRVDANGAFSPSEAPEKLERLAAFDIHSIEQPIQHGQWKDMHQLCKQNILPIALDEELIGINTYFNKVKLLDEIQPQYIILKPSLLGGFESTQEWIKLAEERNIPWWITSALESNIGLNAIAQFTSTYKIEMEQGLGTGSLYTNNIQSKLKIEKGMLWMDEL
ncbi:MAG: o-succinylbenzoate synthase [Brumimicrobium sp.]